MSGVFHGTLLKDFGKRPTNKFPAILTTTVSTSILQNTMSVDREHQDIPRDRAVIPIYPNHSRVNWKALFEVGSVAALAVASEVVGRTIHDARQHVSAEMSREDSPLHDRIQAVSPKQYGLLWDLATAAYLQQQLPVTIEDPTNAEMNLKERVAYRLGSVARRAGRAAEAVTRQVAGVTVALEAHAKATEEHVDLAPILPLAADLGAQAFDNRAQHPPTS